MLLRRSVTLPAVSASASSTSLPARSGERSVGCSAVGRAMRVAVKAQGEA